VLHKRSLSDVYNCLSKKFLIEIKLLPLEKWVTSNIEAHLATIITSIEINSIEWPIFSVGNDVALIGLPVITEAKL
jgi:hypothetical protein